MADPIRLEGIDNFMANTNELIKRMKLKTPLSLAAAGHFIIEEADKIIPIDEGKLKNSAFVEPLPTVGNEYGVALGYSADYAVFVHEMPDSTNWTKEGVESQWFLKTLQKNQNETLDVIRDLSREELNNPFNKRS